MRLPRLFACVLFSLVVTGCTSSGSIDDLVPRPSMEVTSSIGAPDAPTPVADVAAAIADQPDLQAAVATVDPPVPRSRLTRPIAVGAAVETEPGLPAEAVALVAPSRPKAGSSAQAMTIYERRFRDAKPINFGKRSPRSLAVHGVDVSRWQGEIDWQRLRGQGANFVYIKATDGGDHLDPMFKKNWRGAHEAGLKRGAYHFFYWCRTGGEQADWFIRNVPKVKGALPPVIDVEWNGESRCKKRPSRATVLEKMKVFMEKLEAHYGQRPIIYTAPDFYRDNLKGEFLDYPFWLRSVAAHPSKVYPGRDWVFWQYSGSGLSHGVSGRIDLNVFHGSEREWRKWLNQQADEPVMASAD